MQKVAASPRDSELPQIIIEKQKKYVYVLGNLMLLLTEFLHVNFHKLDLSSLESCWVSSVLLLKFTFAQCCGDLFLLTVC